MKNCLKRSSMALSILFVSTSLHALPVYINEFHYDNAGADQNEFVEIAGETGTSLQGWQLEFYNGTNGRRYMTWDLSGSFSEQHAGFGTLSFEGSSGLQNGGSDGMALINDLGEVVQFLSYEGILLATNGSASGLSSEDVGVQETSSTPIGSSIQLTGSAESSEGFSWVVGQSSFGDFNSGQTYLFEETSGTDLAQNMPTVNVSEPVGMSLFGLSMLLLGLRKKNLES